MSGEPLVAPPTQTNLTLCDSVRHSLYAPAASVSAQPAITPAATLVAAGLQQPGQPQAAPTSPDAQGVSSPSPSSPIPTAAAPSGHNETKAPARPASPGDVWSGWRYHVLQPAIIGQDA
jgi:hypothetical protein